MLRWHYLTGAAVLLLVVLMVLAGLGLAVPLFRTLLGLAIALLVGGVLWRAVELVRERREDEVG